MTLDEVRQRYPGAEAFRFGDGPELCDRLLSLVRSGAKTATCGAARDFAAGEALPVIGRRDIALTWEGAPALVIETSEVTRCRFDAVPEEFALAEGEGTFAEWREGHIRYFERNGGWSPDMELVCERFRVVEDLG